MLVQRKTGHEEAWSTWLDTTPERLIGALEAFTLEDPARLVVDLPGIVAASSATGVSVDSDLVTGVRLGAHAGKVRVVIDGGSAAGDFSGRQIMHGDRMSVELRYEIDIRRVVIFGITEIEKIVLYRDNLSARF